MDDGLDLIETLDRIRQQRDGFSAVKSHLLSDDKSQTLLLLYYFVEYADPKSSLEAQEWMDAQTDFSAYRSQRQPSSLCQDAFMAAVELDLCDVAATIAESRRLILSSQTVLAIFQRGKVEFLRVIVGSGVRVDGIKRSCAALGAMKALRELFSSDPEADSGPRVYDLVDFGLKNGVNISAVMSFCMECRELNDSSGINALLAQGREEEAIALLGVYRKVNSSSLAIALNSGCLKYAVEFAGRGIDIKTNRGTIMRSLMKRVSTKLGGEAGNADIYFYVMRKYVGGAGTEDAVEFISAMEKILTPQTLANELWKVLNPIKFLVQLIDLTMSFAAHFDHMSMQFQHLIAGFNRLGMVLLEEVGTEQQMRQLMFDKDLDGREVMGLILERQLISFLDNTLIEKLANEVWKGPYDYTRNPLLPTSTLWKLITGYGRTGVDHEYNTRLKLFGRRISAMHTNRYEFSVWRSCAGLRVLFMGFEYLFLATVLFVCELTLRDAFNKMDNIYSASNEGDFAADQREAYLEQARRARNYTFWWDIMGISILIGSSRIFTVPLFQALTGRCRSVFNVDWTLNLVVFLSMLFIYIPTTGEDQLGMEHIMMDGDELIKKVEDMKDDSYTSILTAVTVFCLSIRLTYMLRFTDFLGPLITILKSMVRKILEFGIFYFIVLFVFALSATLLFSSDDPAFSRIDYIVLTLFQSSIGVFDLNPPDTYAVEGKVFYVVFVFVVNILLLSFVVAVLNEIYAIMSPKNNCSRYQELLALREQYKPHHEYQFMVSSYYIFDIVLCIAFLPIYPLLTSGARKALNRALLYLEYSFCLLIVLLPIYISMELLMIPLAYVLSVAAKVRLVFAARKNRLRHIGSVAFFFFCGPLILMAYLATDVFYCILHAYTHRPTAKTVKEGSDYVSEDAMKDVADYLRDCSTASEEMYSDTAVKGMEGIFSRVETPSVFKHLLLPSLNRILWIARFSVFAHFVSQLSGRGAKSGCVNSRLLYDAFSQFLRTYQLRQHVKLGFPASDLVYGIRRMMSHRASNKYLARVTPVGNKSGMSMMGGVQNVPEIIEPHRRYMPEEQRRIPISALKLYARVLYDRGVEKYNAHDEAGMDVPLQLRKILARLEELCQTFSPSQGSITTSSTGRNSTLNRGSGMVHNSSGNDTRGSKPLLQ
ncbi:MAG: ion transporter [Candidatus Pacebacteria bacterium]|nr:ion transporter [Candidatus Paceibacterota bacterium]